MRLLPRTRTAALITSAVLALPLPVVNQSLLSVVDSAAQRLQLADLVAAAKFPDQPITDKAREQQVLDDAATKATKAGIDPALVVRVFRDQIEAAKVVEYGLFSRWTAHPEQAPKRHPDLPTEVRPPDRQGRRRADHRAGRAAPHDRVPTPIARGRAAHRCAPRVRRPAPGGAAAGGAHALFVTLREPEELTGYAQSILTERPALSDTLRS